MAQAAVQEEAARVPEYDGLEELDLRSRVKLRARRGAPRKSLAESGSEAPSSVRLLLFLKPWRKAPSRWFMGMLV